MGQGNGCSTFNLVLINFQSEANWRNCQYEEQQERLIWCQYLKDLFSYPAANFVLLKEGSICTAMFVVCFYVRVTLSFHTHYL